MFIPMLAGCCPPSLWAAGVKSAVGAVYLAFSGGQHGRGGGTSTHDRRTRIHTPKLISLDPNWDEDRPIIIRSR